MTFGIAILQVPATGRGLEHNTEIVLSRMEEAAGSGADILLLQECFLTGYCLPAGNGQAIEDEAPCLKGIQEAARRLGVGVVATALTKGRERPQNSAFIIDKNGQIRLKYSKVHTCDFSYEVCLESGEDFYVCDFHGVRLGVMICYDREYPESARILMLKGAELILVPNDCESMRPRLQALSTRAYENMVGIAMANPSRKRAGNSCAFSPICWDESGDCVDNQILLVGEEDEGLFYADFDMDQLRRYRAEEMMGNTFRKVKAYGKLLDGTVEEPFVREGQGRR